MSLIAKIMIHIGTILILWLIIEIRIHWYHPSIAEAKHRIEMPLTFYSNPLRPYSISNAISLDAINHIHRNRHTYNLQLRLRRISGLEIQHYSMIYACLKHASDCPLNELQTLINIHTSNLNALIKHDYITPIEYRRHQRELKYQIPYPHTMYEICTSLELLSSHCNRETT